MQLLLMLIKYLGPTAKQNRMAVHAVLTKSCRGQSI